MEAYSLDNQISVLQSLEQLAKSGVKTFTAPFLSRALDISLKDIDIYLSSPLNEKIISKIYRLDNPDNIGESIDFYNPNDIKLNKEYESKETGRTFWVSDNQIVNILYTFNDEYFKKIRSKDISRPKEMSSKALTNQNIGNIKPLEAIKYKQEVSVTNIYNYSNINNGNNNGSIGNNNKNDIKNFSSKDELVDKLEYLYNNVNNEQAKKSVISAKEDIKKSKFKSALEKLNTISAAVINGAHAFDAFQSIVNSINNFIK